MRADPLALPGDGPLYSRIRRALARPILSGEWRPGDRLPSEHALMARYGCSRMTVSRAVAGLAEEGLVERRRRAGTVVAKPRAERAVFEIWDPAAAAAAAGEPYEHRILSRREGRALDGEALALQARPGAPVLRIEVLHLAGGRPVQVESRIVAVDGAPGVLDESFEAITPWRWLLDRVPWTEAEHAISAAPAGEAWAGPLGISPGAPVLVVERRTWQGSRVVTRVELVSPAGAQRLFGRFRPGER